MEQPFGAFVHVEANRAGWADEVRKTTIVGPVRRLGSSLVWVWRPICWFNGHLWRAADLDEILRGIATALEEARPGLDALAAIEQEMNDEVARIMMRLPEDKRAELAALDTSTNELNWRKGTPTQELGALLAFLRKLDGKTIHEVLTSLRRANKKAAANLDWQKYEGRQRDLDALFAKLHEPDEELCIMCGKRRSRRVEPRRAG